MLRKDLSDLPAPSKPEGLAPDDDDTFVRVLVDELAAQPPKPKAGDTLSRHSAAASCLKRVALLRDGVEPEPMDPAGLHVTRIGTLMHEDWQAAAQRKWPNAEMEAASILEDLTSGSGDTLLRAYLPDEDRVIELKTCAVTQYEFMIGMKGPAQGPKPDHKVQLALNVKGHEADSGTLTYLSRSAVSKGKAEQSKLSELLRIGAQWTFPWELEGCGHDGDGCRCLKPLADAWISALEFVRDNPTSEVPRWVMGVMPKGARLDPSSGSWTLRDGDDIIDSGTYWSKGAGCLHYCPVRRACLNEWEAGR